MAKFLDVFEPKVEELNHQDVPETLVYVAIVKNDEVLMEISMVFVEEIENSNI